MSGTRPADCTAVNEPEDGCAPAVAGRRPDDSGFTLIELMVSLSIIALVGTFALSAQVAATRATREQSNRQVAAQLLARELDSVRGLGGSTALELEPTDNQQVNGLSLDITRTIDTCWQVLSANGTTPTCGATELPDSAEMARVVVTVSWLEGNRTQTQSGAVTINADPVFPA